MKRLAVLSLSIFLAGAVLWACGPYFPNFILGSDELVLEGFEGIFTAELARLDNGSRVPFEALPDGDPAAQTARVELVDLEEALTRLGTPAAERRTILEAQTRLRAELDARRATLHDLLWSSRAKEQPAASGQPLPPGLPREFSLYLQGADAYHDGRLDAAVQAWDGLLRLPAGQRHFRSTWAAFMTGKALLYRDPARAAASFQLTRELASQGFADSLGLAASSLGWEAMAETEQGHPEKALILYRRQGGSGDPTADNSLRAAMAEVLEGDQPEALARVARDPEARALLTAWVVSVESYRAEVWLKALQAAEVRDEPNADRIAWTAYLAGDFEQARAWLDRAPESSPMARWIRARLLLRDGKLDEARELLAGVARDLPATGMSLDEAFWFGSGEEVVAAPERAAGEEATLRLLRNDFTGALDELLRAGYWMDAAYLSEQVLTADELKAYVDANWPADLAAKHQPPADEWEPMLAGGYTSPPPERLARDLRYLLGRRLAREGRRSEAGAYLTGEPLAALEALSAHLAAGRDASRSRTARAGELFEASCALRHQGMEVTGTEVDPDWTLVSGNYDLSWAVGDRLVRSQNRLLPMSPEEAARIGKNRVEPRRFHYRFRAADLAWEAARLLPRGDRKAEMLATAGNWIKYHDPEAADRFYKELVRCCGTTDLGREADELRWFPQADACPAEDGGDEE